MAQNSNTEKVGLDTSESSGSLWRWIRDPWSCLIHTVAKRLPLGHLTIKFPDGRVATFEGRLGNQPMAQLELNSKAASRRIMTGGSIGAGESYMRGDWTSPDLTQFLLLAVVNEQAGVDVDETAVARPWHRLGHLLKPNSLSGSRRNIAYHYDLGNAFYREWLDPTMTYSSAWFKNADDTLEEAQIEKYNRIIDGLALTPEHHLLEIGCGWGGFAIAAVRKTGCRVTAVTISREQAELARERVAAAGLSERIDIQLKDYRKISGQYDRIASIEMFEAVGERHWPLFFERVQDLLGSGGKAVMQIITIAEHRFEEYRRNADFIQRYVFPGGMLPNKSILKARIESAGMRMAPPACFGQSYARTLRIWRTRFLDAWPKIEAVGFDTEFRRMWEFYLCYCEAGFTAGVIDVGLYEIEHQSS